MPITYSRRTNFFYILLANNLLQEIQRFNPNF